ncbi:TMV resistance protein N-like [Quercus lobata]|uniref:TMV resistance protein N-like n=1 Tax=Quercus lobata TaxID=97700 RepID=UPI0012474320|nr:TMV resistance protein N-like [Quercus lobata]
MASMSSQRARASSSSFSSTPQWKHDVFLSFYGKDTRKNFTDHLYVALKHKGINVFRDEEKLEDGTFITQELMKAIEESKYAIIVLSKNYALSKWCLNELVKILNCNKEKGLKVIVVFYHVEPSDVRNHRGTFEEAFLKHKGNPKVSINDIERWKDALNEVGYMKGRTVFDRYESKVVQEITEKIFNELNSELPIDFKDLVGIESRVDQIMNLLFGTELDDVCFIGIWGMAGIGKTTLAYVVYDRIQGEFDGSSFICNVREMAKKHDLVYLQQQLLSETLMERQVNIRNIHMGIQVIRRASLNKKLLIIIDDVDEYEQLQALAGCRGWFGPGSRIIITSRDKQLLKRHEVDIYTAKGLNNDEALELFSWKAFKKPYPEENYLELSNDFVKYAKGLPLALEVLGSSLFGRSIDAWKSSRDKLKANPKRKILDTLKIGFDGLEDMHKNLFLDIACFFKGEDKNLLADILTDYDYYMGIETLWDRSLISIFGGKLLIHDLLEEMGWEIVCCESKELGRRSRLFFCEDVLHVLKNETGTELVEGLKLSLPPHEREQLSAETFSMMRKLRLLIIHNVNLPQGQNYLSNELRLLQWTGYPLKSLPESFQPKKLVELIMHHSCIEQLPEGFCNLPELKLIDLSDSQYLIATPNFIGFLKLERLIFQGCIRLCELHPSVGALKHLTLLNLKECKSLNSLPSEINLESLEIFILSGCSRLKKFSEIGTNMTCLSELYLDGAAIEELPVSIEHLTGLTLLSLQDCNNFGSFPNVKLPSLRTLNLTGCKGQPSKSSHSHRLSLIRPTNTLETDYFSPTLYPNQEPIHFLLPRLSGLGFIVRLNLSDCNLSDGALPDDLSCLVSLQYLVLNKNKFTRLPDSISQIFKLTFLELNDCSRLQSLPILPSRSVFVYAKGCTSLETYSSEYIPWNTERGFCFFNCFDKSAFSYIFSSYSYGATLWNQFVEKIGSNLTTNCLYKSTRSQIPEGFSNKSTGSSVTIPLPCLGGSPLVFDFQQIFPSISSSFEFHAFLSAEDLREHLEGCSHVSASIESDHLDIEIQMFGARILYEQDLIDFPQVLYGGTFKLPGSCAKYQPQVASFQRDLNIKLKRKLESLLFRLYLQGDRVRNHKYDYIFPCIKIPAWFRNQSFCSDIRMKLPANLQEEKRLMGIAVCAYYTVNKQLVGYSENQDLTSFLNFYHPLSSNEVLTRHKVFQDSKDIFVGSSCRILVFYLPHMFFGLKGCAYIEASFEHNNSGVRVKECGIRLVYEQDVEEFVQILVKCMLQSPEAYHNFYYQNLVDQVRKMMEGFDINEKDSSSYSSLQRLKFT